MSTEDKLENVSPTFGNTLLNKTFGSYISSKGLILRPI